MYKLVPIVFIGILCSSCSSPTAPTVTVSPSTPVTVTPATPTPTTLSVAQQKISDDYVAKIPQIARVYIFSSTNVYLYTITLITSNKVTNGNICITGTGDADSQVYDFTIDIENISMISYVNSTANIYLE